MRRWCAAVGGAALALLLALLLAGCGGAGAPQGSRSAADTGIVVGSQGQVEHVPSDGSGFGVHGDYSIYLPPGYGQDPRRRYPVVYLLHGGSGSDSFFLDLGIRDAMDAGLASGAVGPMILVLVDGGPMFDGGGAPVVDFDEYFASELVPTVDRTWRTEPERAGRAVGGISVGGRHALAIAAENPSLVVAVGAHSTTVTHLPPGAVDSLAAARVAVYLDVGRSDGLFASDEALAGSLRRQGPTCAGTRPRATTRRRTGAHTCSTTCASTGQRSTPAVGEALSRPARPSSPGR